MVLDENFKEFIRLLNANEVKYLVALYRKTKR